MTAVDTIARVRTGVAQILLERDRQVVGSGTAFLTRDRLVTNSHIIRRPGIVETVMLRFEHVEQPIRLSFDHVEECISNESQEDEGDYVLVELDETEFENLHRFDFGELNDVKVGEQVLFLGYPFGMVHLTAHLGYISSIHRRNETTIIQIDGSINGGNSGGPLIDLKSGNVVGVITRAVTGLIEQEFRNLIQTLRENERILAQTGAVISVDGIDPIQGLRASMAAMAQIASNLARSANVGIGYAYSSDHFHDL